ncbi:MAG: outer membrane lipoprotein chaperone LolA [Deltaproteobacteria bacterium]|nr:outer membrane lipoprotein chaperone LolA [Deltaproteobacteria bacterium]
MRIVIFVLVSTLILSVSHVLAKENENLDHVLNRIQEKYEKINDFSSKFTQEATVKALNKVQRAQGEVWFKKPGKMRWNYLRPTKDEIVSDGITIWFYNEEEKQVIESPLSEVIDTPTTTTLISGLGNLKNLFDARFSKSHSTGDNNAYLIDLSPRDNSEEFNSVTIAVDKDSLLVNTIYLYDPFGNLTTVKLNNIEINNGIPDSLFIFKAPKGAETTKVPPFGR